MYSIHYLKSVCYYTPCFSVSWGGGELGPSPRGWGDPTGCWQPFVPDLSSGTSRSDYCKPNSSAHKGDWRNELPYLQVRWENGGQTEVKKSVPLLIGRERLNVWHKSQNENLPLSPFALGKNSCERNEGHWIRTMGIKEDVLRFPACPSTCP